MGSMHTGYLERDRRLGAALRRDILRGAGAWAVVRLIVTGGGEVERGGASRRTPEGGVYEGASWALGPERRGRGGTGAW